MNSAQGTLDAKTKSTEQYAYQPIALITSQMENHVLKTLTVIRKKSMQFVKTVHVLQIHNN